MTTLTVHAFIRMVEPIVKVGNIILLSLCDGADRRIRQVVRGRTKEHATSQPLSFQRAPSGLRCLLVPVTLILALKRPPIASLEIYVPSSVLKSSHHKVLTLLLARCYICHVCTRTRCV